MAAPSGISIASFGRIPLPSGLSVGTRGRLVVSGILITPPVPEGVITIAAYNPKYIYTKAEVLERIRSTGAKVTGFTSTDTQVVAYLTRTVRASGKQYTIAEIPTQVRQLLAEYVPTGLEADYLVNIDDTLYLVTKDEVFVLVFSTKTNLM